jgi:type IV pilus assembly protein PilA
MKNNKKGFTLIELLAVIVILAILAGITAIMVTNYIENSKINADRLNAQNITNAVLREWQVQGNESNRQVYVFVDKDTSQINSSDLLEKPLANSPWTDEGYETARAIIDVNGNVRICLYDSKAQKGVIGDYQEIAADEDLKAKEPEGEIIDEETKVIRLKYRNITQCPDEFYPSTTTETTTN